MMEEETELKLFFVLLILLIFGISLFLSNKGSGNRQKKAVQDVLNVIDIGQNYIYTADQYLIGFLQISGRKTDLLSEMEQRNLTHQMTAEVSTCDFPWQILALSQPEDNSSLIYQYQILLDTTQDLVRKKLLREAVQFQNNLMLSGENVERQFFVKVWETERDGAEKDLMDKLMQLAKCFEGSGYAVSILHKSELIQLSNLIHNPSAVIYENDMDTGVLTGLEGYHEV